jgi:hypothetical protein
MRIPAFVRTLLPLLLLSFPAIAFAQFQAPTPEELKMTSDPKAPGADAVYLNIEEVTNDPLHYHSFYARIKVLQEKGKELATVQIPYEHRKFKVGEIKGRTIHPDGTIVPLEGKPEDLLIAKRGEAQINKTVFNLPSVEVGSIIEYRYQINYDDDLYSAPDWQIQRKYYVHKAHYFFTPFKGFMKGAQNETSRYLVDSHGRVADSLIWWTILPAGVKPESDASGRYTLDISDIDAAPDEEWMPPTDSVLFKVRFYYMDSRDSADYWATNAKRWAHDVDHFADTSKSFRQVVSGLVSPADSEVEKARKLYLAVQALDNTDYSRSKGKTELKSLGMNEAKDAEDIWKRKSGSSNQIAMLYLAMLRAAGITAYDMTLVDRANGLFSPGYLSFDQFDDDIVIAKLDGKEVILDPGEKMCPFEMVDWRHSAATGIRETPEGRSAATTSFQDYTGNAIFRAGDLTLDPHGAVTGTIQYTMTGQDALRWRQDALRNDLDEVKKHFDESLQNLVPEGVQAHVDHFQALDNPYEKLVAVVNVKGSLGAATSKRLLLPGFFFETRAQHPFINEEKRLEPVDMHYGEKVTDQVVYHLPPGFTVEGAPQNSKEAWTGYAALAVVTRSDPGQIAIARELVRGFTLVKPAQYQDLRGFYQKIAAADQQQLVLDAPSAAKGN